VYITRRVAPTAPAVVDPGYEQEARRAIQTLYSDWTPANKDAHEENVEVYSNCEEVELLLNGKSLGVKPLNANAAPRVWRVPYEAGTLKAIGKNGGKQAATYELRTAGAPAKILLSSDRPRIGTSFDDVATITVTIADANGVVVPNAESLVHFHIDAPGAIAAVDNADYSSHESFQAPERHAFQGHCVAVVRAGAPGRMMFTASVEGLGRAALVIEATK